MHPGDGSGSRIAWWPKFPGMPYYTGIQGAGAQVNAIFPSVTSLRDVSQDTKIGTGIIIVAGIATMIGMLWSAARSVEHNRRRR